MFVSFKPIGIVHVDFSGEQAGLKKPPTPRMGIYGNIHS